MTGASWSLIDAVTLQGMTGATLPDVYVRVHADGMPDAGDAPTTLLVHVQDQKLADHVAGVLARAAEEPNLPFEDATLTAAHPIEGLLEDGLTVDYTDQKGVRAALGERLAGDYRVIAQAAKPDDSGRGTIVLAVGLAVMALAALLLLRRGGGSDEEAGEALAAE